MLYLENFQPYMADRRVYPYRVLYPMQLESIDFAPITIIYGSNGCGGVPFFMPFYQHLIIYISIFFSYI